MGLVKDLMAGQQAVEAMLQMISDEPSTKRGMELLGKLRVMLVHHRELETVQLFPAVEASSPQGKMLVAEARARHDEEVDLLETLYDFGSTMDPVLWVEMFADLQSLMERNFEYKQKYLYPLAASGPFLTDAAG